MDIDGQPKGSADVRTYPLRSPKFQRKHLVFCPPVVLQLEEHSLQSPRTAGAHPALGLMLRPCNATRARNARATPFKARPVYNGCLSASSMYLRSYEWHVAQLAWRLTRGIAFT